MLPRNELLLRAVCIGAGAILLYQAGHLLLHANPLSRVRIPELPTLTNTTQTAATPTVPTNAPQPRKDSTNAPANVGKSSTNSAGVSTNSIVSDSNQPPVLAVGTNAPGSTNRAELPESVKIDGTNVAKLATDKNSTNAPSAVSSSNRLVGGNSPPRPPPGMPPGARFPGGMGGPGMQMAELPKETRAKLERIIDSEILAPVMRPMPLALLGIAGEDAFLRGANGQTGLVREGQSLGSVKVLKIGINRVLVEEDGETKELTIFGGMGSTSLMSATKTNSP